MKKAFYFLLFLIFSWNCNQKTETTCEESISRNDISETYKWDLSSLCSDSISWGNDYKAIETEIDKFGKSEFIITNSQDLFRILYKKDSLYNELLRLYLYAMMQEHVDLNDESAQIMRMQMDILESKFTDAFTFDASILELGTRKLKKWIKENEELKQYDFFITKLINEKEHTPEKKQQQILNRFSLASETVNGIYDELFYSDLNEPDFDRNIPDRNKRIKDFQEYIKFYTSKRNTVAALIVSDLQLKYAYAKSVGYESLLDEDLDYDKVPDSIYHTLYTEMKSGSKALQEYHKLRAEYLKISNYQPADKNFIIFPPQTEYNYDTAKIIIKKALEPLEQTYNRHLCEMLDSNKIDVFNNKGKLSSVAYTVSMFGKTPYILTTYENRLKDIFDLIHELGHAVHVMFSMDVQPISNYAPSILKDEITSTFNELLLIDYLLENASDTRQRLHVLETAINNMEYYFRQSLNTEFTFGACSAIESDEAVTASYLDSLYKQIYQNYYGNSITNVNPSSWTKYGMLDYYSYKYVISMTASLVFYESIVNGGEPDVEKYLEFLEMGGNNYPLEQLKAVGINLDNETVLSSIVTYTEKLINLYKKELKKYVKYQ
ncbi:MAG: hypothetical protein JXB49_32190 [Bacteroidales bacterium]|nr:hypothetical protein [Bacteroidales bacterium]